MSIAENIKRLRLEANLTQEQLAEKLDITRPTVTQWESGWSQPRMGMVEKLAQVFNVSLSNIVDESIQENLPKGAFLPVRSKPAYAPLLGRIHAGKAQEPEVLEDEVELPASVLDKHPRAFFLEVEGDCMDKVYTEYSNVLIDPDREPQDGSIAAVCIDGNDVVMRRLKRGANTLILSPESNNPEHKDIVVTSDSDHVVENVGTVIWFQAKKEMG